ncbi:MAG: protein kinase, partial [Myxococcales bacterium]|nr:protein kinase [Myxococcales bacterium]
PHNVLLSVSGEVKLGDFGIARIASEDSTGLHIQGKLRYMAPEQAAGESREPTVDLYAVGALLHELLEGRRFHAEVPRSALFAKVISGEIPPLRRQNVPLALRVLRTRLLAPDPLERIASARAALEILGHWASPAGARLALADLVRHLSGIEGPRSGLDFSQSSAESQVGRPKVDLTALTDSEADEADEANTSVFFHQASTPPKVVMKKPPGIGRYLVLGVGLTIGLIAAVVSQSWSSLSKSSVENSEYVSGEFVASERQRQETVQARKAGKSTPHLRGHSPTPPPTVSAPVPAAEQPSGPEPKSEPVIEKVDEPASKPRHKESKALAEVRFAAYEFHYLDIRVAERVHGLDPALTVKLPAGHHRVDIREGSGSEWVAAGYIDVAAGGHYTVKFKIPGTIDFRGS